MSTPERSGREGDQPLPVPGQGDIIAELIGLLEERRATGVRRYGRPLQAFNGRDASRDLEEELLDAAAYARQSGRERAATDLALVTLARRARGLDTEFGSVDAALEVADAVALKLGRNLEPKSA